MSTLCHDAIRRQQWQVIRVDDGSGSELCQSSKRLDLVGGDAHGARLVEGDDVLGEGLGRAPVQDQRWWLRGWNLACLAHYVHASALADCLVEVLHQRRRRDGLG